MLSNLSDNNGTAINSPQPSEDDLVKLRMREKRLVRKIDWILMPILTVTLGLQYYDKAVLGNAAVFGILKDLVSVRRSLDDIRV